MNLGIIGASSQVGSSLALYLKKYLGIVPVCFIRSTYAAIFFDVSEIEYRIIDLTNQAELRKEFEDIDLFIDCSYPSGQLFEIAGQIRSQLKILFSAMPSKASFIYCSTIMAFGMPEHQKLVKKYFIPRSTYAHLKRIAERTVKRLSQKYTVPCYIFRLGQVHGFLQSVNTSFREKLSMNKAIRLDGNPDDMVNIIFIETLAEAVIKVGMKEIPTGSYSLVNNPQWTLKQLYDYYISYYSFEVNMEFMESEGSYKKPWYKISLGSFKKYRALLEIFFLIRNKNMYIKVKGKYRKLDIKRSMNSEVNMEYTDFHLLGKNPGKLLTGLHCDPKTLLSKEKEMEELYSRNLENNIADKI